MLDKFSRSVLDFERSWWLLPGPKDVLIGAELECSAADFYNHLITLLDERAAYEYDPLTVLRLRRLRESVNPSLETAGSRSR
jgi:hypothetical protein